MQRAFDERITQTRLRIEPSGSDMRSFETPVVFWQQTTVLDRALLEKTLKAWCSFSLSPKSVRQCSRGQHPCRVTELKHFVSAIRKMLSRVWSETEFRLDICCYWGSSVKTHWAKFHFCIKIFMYPYWLKDYGLLNALRLYFFPLVDVQDILPSSS